MTSSGKVRVQDVERVGVLNINIHYLFFIPYKYNYFKTMINKAITLRDPYIENVKKVFHFLNVGGL